jgi:hypothetical protein
MHDRFRIPRTAPFIARERSVFIYGSIIRTCLDSSDLPRWPLIPMRTHNSSHRLIVERALSTNSNLQ